MNLLEACFGFMAFNMLADGFGLVTILSTMVNLTVKHKVGPSQLLEQWEDYSKAIQVVINILKATSKPLTKVSSATVSQDSAIKFSLLVAIDLLEQGQHQNIIATKLSHCFMVASSQEVNYKI